MSGPQTIAEHDVAQLTLTTHDSRARLNTSKPRRTSLNGRDYLVCPAVMIRPGVLVANNGSIYYGPSAVNNRVDRWNNVPLTLNHPVDAMGNRVSARTPQASADFEIGRVFNARFSDGKLRGEAWFDIKRTNDLSPGLINRISKGEVNELSTGLYTMTRNRAGQANGKEYTKQLVAYEPDHLAVLTDEPGACSVKDGCGINTNSAAPDPDPEETEVESEGADFQDIPTPRVTVNTSGLSHSDIRGALQKLLQNRYNTGGKGSDRLSTYVDILDVYPDKVVYSTSGLEQSSIGYKVEGNTISLEGEPVAVVSTRTYRPVSPGGQSSVTFQTTDNKKTGCGCGCGGKKGGCGGHNHADEIPGFQPTTNAKAGNCGIGAAGFQPGNKCGGKGGGGSSKAASTRSGVSPKGSVKTKLPKNPQKLSTSQARSALKDLGISLGPALGKKVAGKTTYGVRDSKGNVSLMTSADIKKMVYAKPGSSTPTKPSVGKLPKKKSKLSMTQAASALSKRGMKMQSPKTQKINGKFVTSYKVTRKDGKSLRIAAGDIKKFLYTQNSGAVFNSTQTPASWEKVRAFLSGEPVGKSSPKTKQSA